MSAGAKRRARSALSSRNGWVCHYCSKPLIPDGEWDTYCDKTRDGYSARPGYSFPVLDHLTPSSRGGGNKIDNLVLSCDMCNMRKNDKTEPEFIDWLK